MRLTKEEFCEAVNKYEEMYRKEHEIIKTLDINPEWAPSTWLDEYYNFLNKMCDFTQRGYENDLDYYCFDLDFGKKWKPRMIIVNNKDVPCRNAEELWDLITNENY